MTPKEKAEELYQKFLRYAPAEEEFEHVHTIQCALIAVDEILNDLKESLEIAGDFHPHAKGIIAGSLLAWQKVKIEIEKL
jgi:hypothetical protein